MTRRALARRYFFTRKRRQKGSHGNPWEFKNIAFGRERCSALKCCKTHAFWKNTFHARSVPTIAVSGVALCHKKCVFWNHDSQKHCFSIQIQSNLISSDSAWVTFNFKRFDSVRRILFDLFLRGDIQWSPSSLELLYEAPYCALCCILSFSVCFVRVLSVSMPFWMAKKTAGPIGHRPFRRVEYSGRAFWAVK